MARDLKGFKRGLNKKKKKNRQAKRVANPQHAKRELYYSQNTENVHEGSLKNKVKNKIKQQIWHNAAIAYRTNYCFRWVDE